MERGHVIKKKAGGKDYFDGFCNSGMASNGCLQGLTYPCFISESKESKSIPVNFNLMDSSGNTPLSLALITGMQHMVAVLIQGE
jgi:ankyrin repeat protein